MKSVTLRMRKFLVIALVLITGAIAIGSYTGLFRELQLGILYSDAMHGSTSEGLSAIEALSSDSSESATRFLLRIASDATVGPLRIKEASIAALSKRTSDTLDIPAAVARLIVPEKGLAFRHAASQALGGKHCSSLCADSLMSYLYRLSQGELNVEHKLVKEGVLPPHDQETLDYLNRLQEQLETNIMDVLQGSQSASLDVLVSRYGMGAETIDPFAIRLAGSLNLISACPLLIRSRSASEHEDLRQAIDDTLQFLNCDK